VEVQIDLVTAEEARAKPVGKGREEPNDFPFLPPPDRPETSFAPFRPDQYIQQVFWKRYKFKLCGCCIVFGIIALAIIVVWVLKTFFNFF